MGQGDGDAIRGVDLLASWGSSGPQTFSPALTFLPTTEPHFVGQLCACSRHDLTGGGGRAAGFPGPPPLLTSSFPHLPCSQGWVWTPAVSLDPHLFSSSFLRLDQLQVCGPPAPSSLPSTQELLEPCPVLLPPFAIIPDPGLLPQCQAVYSRVWPPHLPFLEATTAFFYMDNNVYIQELYI